MTTPCTRCGEPVAPDELRCPHCDALAPLPDDAGTDPTVVDDAPPWAIPIREPSAAPTQHGHPVAPRGGAGRVAALVLLGVALFAAVVVAGAQLLTDDGRDEASVTPPAEGTNADVGTEGDLTDGAGVDDAATSSTSTSTTSSTTSSTTTTTAVASTTAPPTSRAPAPSGTGAVPRLSSFGGGWVAVLSSMYDTADADQVEAAYEEVRAYAPDARVTHSDDWPSLADGYWVLVEPGPFDSADDVRSFCASVDPSRGDCAPRRLRR